MDRLEQLATLELKNNLKFRRLSADLRGESYQARNLANLEAFRRIRGGGMYTRFRPLELNSLWPGDQCVSWPVDVIDERNGPAREIYGTLVRGFAGIELRRFN